MNKSELLQKISDAFSDFVDSNFGGTNNQGNGIPLLKALDEDLMQAVEVVYEPFKLDAHGQWMSDTTVKSMAKQLWEGYEEGEITLNLFHMEDVGPEQVELTKVEVLEDERQYGDNVVPKGTAIAYLQYHDKALWKMRKEQQIGGLSVGGWSQVNIPKESGKE